MDIRIGVPVIAEDGQAGKVERVILHPATNEIEGIVAAQGWLLTRDVVIPVDRILAAGEDGLRVRGTAEEIGSLDPFAQSQYTVPPEEWIPPSGDASAFYLFPASPYAVGAFMQPATQPDPAEHEVEALAAGDVEVSGTTMVHCTDGVGGKVDRVITEGDSDKVTHMVVQRGALRPRDIVVPVEHVARIGEDGVYLTLTQDALDKLPTFEE